MESDSIHGSLSCCFLPVCHQLGFVILVLIQCDLLTYDKLAAHVTRYHPTLMPSSSYKNFSNNVFSSSPFVLDKSIFLRGLNSDYVLALYKKAVLHYGNQVCMF